MGMSKEIVLRPLYAKAGVRVLADLRILCAALGRKRRSEPLAKQPQIKSKMGICGEAVPTSAWTLTGLS
jgi:hypothetical protein